MDIYEITKLPLNLQWKKFQESIEDKSKWDILDFSSSSITELNSKYKAAISAGYTPIGGMHSDPAIGKLRCYLAKLK
jgi:hypothetical protein